MYLKSVIGLGGTSRVNRTSRHLRTQSSRSTKTELSVCATSGMSAMTARLGVKARALRSRIYAPTLREAPADAATPGHQLLVRAGFLRKSSMGHFVLLPLGLRVLQKLEGMIDRQMQSIGGQKVVLPSLLPKEMWQASGRWASTGDELIKLTDRHGHEHCLAPTHEEAITTLVASDLTSYRQLPTSLYQVGTKFRDEQRPRFGLLRAREFVMKDMYSFHSSLDCARDYYEAVVGAYRGLFEQIGVGWRQVEADTGNIGGSLSDEFHMLCEETGEDLLLHCNNCSYAANSELAVGESTTPGVGAEVAKQALESIRRCPVTASADSQLPLKLEFFHTDDGQLAVVLNQHDLVNDVKLERAVQAILRPLNNPSKDTPTKVLVDQRGIDLRLSEGGDMCTKCGTGELQAVRGIEVGHCFLLGDKYSVALHAMFSHPDQNQLVPAQMGCYGLGLTRMIAAVAEVSHDTEGLIWPWSVAPYKAMALAEELHDQLDEVHGLCGEVCIDDRKIRGGVKLKEAALMGFPLTVVIGRAWTNEGKLELKVRNDDEPVLAEPKEIVAILKQRVKVAQSNKAITPS